MQIEETQVLGQQENNEDMHLQDKKLVYIRDTTWTHIFDQWRNLESWQDSWAQHWCHRGFDSWEQWRRSYVKPLAPEKRIWKLYKICDFDAVGEFYGVPSKGWIDKCYGGKLSQKIADIQENPVVSENNKISEMVEQFPLVTMLTGVIMENNIYLIDGMHRANALEQIHSSGREIKSEVYIALAQIEIKELKPLGSGDTYEK